MKSSRIIDFKVFKCGYEEFNFSELYRMCDYGQKKLPVNVILLEHRKYGNILINTGCTSEIRKNPIQFAKLLTERRISFSENDSIISQLEELKMDAVCIKKVLLTHCIPECCGALPLIPRYELLSGARVLSTMFVADPSDGVMKSTLPESSITKKAGGLFKGTSVIKPYFKWVFDMFGDGSVLGFDISGSNVSMMGYFIPEINFLFAADASIDETAINENLIPTDKLLKMQAYPDDYISVLATIRKLHKEHPEIKISFLHSENINIKI